MDERVIVIGPMAPILVHGVESVTAADAGVRVRHCREWPGLGVSVAAIDEPFVIVGIDEEFDRERAYELSVECPSARIVACELHAAELSVMRAGRVQRAGRATPAGLAAVLGLREDA